MTSEHVFLEFVHQSRILTIFVSWFGQSLAGPCCLRHVLVQGEWDPTEERPTSRVLCPFLFPGLQHAPCSSLCLSSFLKARHQDGGGLTSE